MPALARKLLIFLELFVSCQRGVAGSRASFARLAQSARREAARASEPGLVLQIVKPRRTVSSAGHSAIEHQPALRSTGTAAVYVAKACGPQGRFS